MAVMGSRPVAVEGRSTNNTKCKAIPLAGDRKPHRHDDRVRIRQTGARVLSLDQLEPIGNDDSNNGEAELVLGDQLDQGGDPPRV